jgi:hypothetical protein
LNPNATGSPMLRYRTLIPAASTRCASTTMLRIAYEKRPILGEIGSCVGVGGTARSYPDPS